MSLADLRKELKSLRKTAMPTPVSRMKKTDCVREIERLRILHAKEEASTKETHATEEKAVKKVMKTEAVPKKVAEKVEAVQKKSHAKEEKMEKKAHKKEERPPHGSPPSPTGPSKFIKGSEEAKARMAALRAMRKKKE